MSERHVENLFTDKKMSVAEAAYLAGILDGEGIISLHSNGRGRRRWSIVPAVKVGNTSLELLLAVREMAGNGRITYNGRTSTTKDIYRWELTPDQIRWVLPQVRPYLVYKFEQADIVNEFLALKSGRGISDDEWEHAVGLMGRMRVLNRRGVPDQPLPTSEMRPPRDRKQTCDEEGCTLLRYGKWRYCHTHWLQRQEPDVKKCEECGVHFETRNPRKRFCTDRCQWQGYARNRAARQQQRAEGD